LRACLVVGDWIGLIQTQNQTCTCSPHERAQREKIPVRECGSRSSIHHMRWLTTLGATYPAASLQRPYGPARDVEIPVWGWADPGEPVSVRLAGNVRETVTGPEGQWHVTLPAEPAGGPFVLLVKVQKTIVLLDVLIGEVWVASGQSNMAYALSGATGGEDAASAAKFAGIRFFTVPQKIALVPQQDTLSASWETCTPETARKFSAVAFFFAQATSQRTGCSCRNHPECVARHCR